MQVLKQKEDYRASRSTPRYYQVMEELRSAPEPKEYDDSLLKRWLTMDTSSGA
jgi:hypothetical protein